MFKFDVTCYLTVLMILIKLLYFFYMHEYIRPKRVIQWLKQNNPLYKDITICSDWENQWEDEDLWETIAKHCPPTHW